MSGLTDEEVKVLQLLDKGELSAMTVPEEMRGLLAPLMERGLVWALDRRGMTFFKVSTEGGRRLGMHYEMARHRFEESQKVETVGDARETEQVTVLAPDVEALLRLLLPDGLPISAVPADKIDALFGLKKSGLVEELWKNLEVNRLALTAEGRKALGVSEPEVLYTAEVYFKSGNVVVLDRVVSLTVTHRGGGVTGFKLEQKLDARRRLLVQSLDLTQIEAVTSTEEDSL